MAFSREKHTMKRISQAYLYAAVAFAFLLGSCAVPSPEVGGGSFSYKVQAISQIVMDTLAKHPLFSMKSTAPKAYIAAQKVEFSVTEAGNPGNVVDSWTDYPSIVMSMVGYEVGQRTLPAGSYTLNATVYNDSTDAVPTVSGQSDFIITEGQVATDHTVIVLCTPANAIQHLSENTESAPYMLTKPWAQDTTTGQLTIGDEMWFEIAPTGPGTEVVATPCIGSLAGIYLFLFDEAGNFVDEHYPTDPGQPTTIPCALTPASTHYYVGVIDMMYMPAENRSFTIRYEQSPGMIKFAGSNQIDVFEDCNTVTLTVSRTGNSGAVTIDYMTYDGSAMAGYDYDAVSDTLSWADGDDSDRTISISVTGDGDQENREYFFLTLGNPTGGATLGYPNMIEIYIDDDDGPSTVAFTSRNHTVNESDGTVTISLRRVGDSSAAAEATCTTMNGTATSGTDYTGTTSTLSWPIGDTTVKSFTVPILNDSNTESDEVFNVYISACSCLIGGYSSSSLVYIIDDD